MQKYSTTQQFQRAVFAAFTLRVTVGDTGDVSEQIAQRALRAGCIKATLWGFDSAGNNVVEFKALT